jgi:hypothetical protein
MLVTMEGITGGLVRENTTFCDKVKAIVLNIPTLHHRFSFLWVTIRKNTLKPISDNLTHEELIFNYCPSRARLSVENGFGILSTWFIVLHTKINTRREK